MRPRATPLLAALLAALLGLSLELAAARPGFAQIDISIRNSFPGRRIGGNTRSQNPCWTRQFVHLVPVNSIFSPDLSGRIGLLEAPSPSQRPLQIEIHSLKPDGQLDPQARLLYRRELAPSPAGITLLNLPVFPPATSWSSSYVCPENPPPADDPLFFITSGEPPALSLLMKGFPRPDDLRVRDNLNALARHCGANVNSQWVIDLFGLTDLDGPNWPEVLPVRCLSGASPPTASRPHPPK